MFKKARKLLPRTQRRLLRCLDILAEGFGQAKSMQHAACLDANGEPVPWYTYPTIEYLRQLDFSGCSVFEYGCGNSTLFWGKLAREVTSVESDPEWFERVRDGLTTDSVQVHLATEQDAYVQFPRSRGKFDVVIVDGMFRGLCVREAIHALQTGGLLIFDNSDWYPKATAFLRESGFIQVDMSGFGPINDFTWTTSLFFHPEFKIQPRDTRQPMPSVGSLHQFAADDC